MAVAIAGKLNIIERKYKNGSGSFYIGELETEIGNFSIRNDALMQFNPGSYAGNYMITRIYPHTSPGPANRIFLETRAELDWAALAILSESALDDTPSIAVEAAAQAEETVIEQAQQVDVKPAQSEGLFSDDDAEMVCSLSALETLLAASAPVIKLDRSLSSGDGFREMVSKVKGTGLYRFEFTDQSWVRK